VIERLALGVTLVKGGDREMNLFSDKKITLPRKNGECEITKQK
jgi:hypothetical protein